MFTALLVCVFIVAVFFLAAHLEAVQEFLQTLCNLLAQPFASLTKLCSFLSQKCLEGCSASLRWPPYVYKDRNGGNGYWDGINVVGRLVLCIAGLCVIFGDWPVMQLAFAAFFGEAPTKLHLPLDLISALTWVMVPILFGAVLLETAELVPIGTKLFPTMGKRTRIVIGVIALLFLIVAIVAIGWFFLWRQIILLANQGGTEQQVQALLDQLPFDQNELSLWIAFAFGIVIAASSPIAIEAIIVGAAGVCTLLFALCWLLASLACWLCSNLAIAIAGVGNVLSALLKIPAMCGKSVWNTLCSYRWLRFLHFRAIGQDIPQNVSEQQADEDADIKTVVQKPPEPLTKEKPMGTKQQTITLGFINDFGYRFAAPCINQFLRTGVWDSVLATFVYDFSRPMSNRHIVDVPKAQNFTPLPQELSHALSAMPEHAHQTILQSRVDKIVRAYSPDKRTHGYIFLPIGLLAVIDSEAPLMNLHDRLNQHTIVLMTQMPEKGLYPQEQIKKAIAAVQRLQDGGATATTIVVERLSPKALTEGESTQQASLATGIVGLLTAHRSPFNNPSFGQFGEIMKRQSAFTGVSIASAPIALGKTPWFWNGMQKAATALPDRSYGDIDDCLTQAKLLTDQVFSNAETKTLHALIDRNKPAVAVCTIPFRQHHPRIGDFANTYQSYVARTYPNVMTILVNGNGTPDPRSEAAYYAQVTLFYPITETDIFSDSQDERANGAKPSVSPLNGNPGVLHRGL